MSEKKMGIARIMDATPTASLRTVRGEISDGVPNYYEIKGKTWTNESVYVNGRYKSDCIHEECKTEVKKVWNWQEEKRQENGRWVDTGHGKWVASEEETLRDSTRQGNSVFLYDTAAKKSLGNDKSALQRQQRIWNREQQWIEEAEAAISLVGEVQKCVEKHTAEQQIKSKMAENRMDQAKTSVEYNASSAATAKYDRDNKVLAEMERVAEAAEAELSNAWVKSEALEVAAEKSRARFEQACEEQRKADAAKAQ